MSTLTQAPAARPPDRLLADELEASLRDLVADLPEAQPPRRRGPGRPATVSATLLWLGFLLCVLRGFASQRAVWRLLCLHGFWGSPAKPLTESAIYQRLARSVPTAFQTLFARVTALLVARYAAVCDLGIAAFATEIYALDHCVLDPVLRKLKLLRTLRPGDPSLIPGRLASLFDVRRQLFQRVEFEEDAQRNVKFGVERLLEGLAKGTLLLFDLGYFSFPWFDLLTQQGFYYVSRLREKTSWQEIHQLGEVVELFAGGNAQVRLREAWVYLGKYRADRAAEAVRLVEVCFPHVTYRYITNVLDPRLLPAADLVRLYSRRWDIEQAFNLLKTHLKLYVLCSGRPNVVQLQVFASLIIAQVVLALRTDLALRARADLREISLPLLLECLPRLAADGKDPLHELAVHGRRMKIIRPFRGREYVVPEPPPEAYQYPAARPPPRVPRYAGKDAGPGRKARASPEKPPRKRRSGWGVDRRKAR